MHFSVFSAKALFFAFGLCIFTLKLTLFPSNHAISIAICISSGIKFPIEATINAIDTTMAFYLRHKAHQIMCYCGLVFMSLFRHTIRSNVMRNSNSQACARTHAQATIYLPFTLDRFAQISLKQIKQFTLNFVVNGNFISKSQFEYVEFGYK